MVILPWSLRLALGFYFVSLHHYVCSSSKHRWVDISSYKEEDVHGLFIWKFSLLHTHSLGTNVKCAFLFILLFALKLGCSCLHDREYCTYLQWCFNDNKNMHVSMYVQKNSCPFKIWLSIGLTIVGAGMQTVNSFRLNRLLWHPIL